MLERLFPRQVDNSFDGHRAALWLLGLFVGLKLVMSINSMLNPAAIATGDGLPLIVQGYMVPRTGTSPVIWFLTFGLVGLLAIGLVLSLLPARERAATRAA